MGGGGRVEDARRSSASIEDVQEEEVQLEDCDAEKARGRDFVVERRAVDLQPVVQVRDADELQKEEGDADDLLD